MDLDTVLTSLAESVRERRTAAGLTLEQLAQRAELTSAHLSSVGSGDRQPSLGVLISLARALGTSAGSLLGETGECGALAVYVPTVSCDL